ncbi:type IV pili methyl-accepting chemotaxis transducer N-terminal domain-containing protein [Cognatiyoonia sp. IB215446]|uniref:type IV pili methyl-accepting chemotaxis transducer N-terminal domain-containing protein n=1 Tax=Cognatiyoonia sp. IB215446 TaxID=3097355 RepID=UPI002A0D2766|nr:type IV pili methyl-accepting chemotaxis transducer N-terminal domain-containing protein [Cognatiyoonia sp. IB215446]MDX8348988.1 type IV pili methyl-accepting chemotaxis transducer N-terminal domain-containing protein [Cognatiyoonia sp. IB215446]
MLRTLISAGLLSTALLTPAVASAQSAAVSSDDPSVRINVAGRQRMLSQRMTKAACLMAQDIDATAAYDQLTQAYELFTRTDVALRDGDPSMRLGPETHSDVISALQRVDPHWATYMIIAEKGIDEAYVEYADLAVMDETGLDVLKFMNIAVYKTARAWAEGSENLDLGLAITIDIAGRQRMLTQLAVKNVCLMREAEDPTVYADSLANAVELFDSSLLALQDGFGDIGVIAPPTTEISQTLREVSELWQPIRVVMDRAADGDPISDRELSSLARDTELLLQKMNEAVGLYAASTSAS